MCRHVDWEHAVDRILCQNFGQKNDETGDMGPNHVTVSPVNYVGHLSITPATYSHRDEK